MNRIVVAMLAVVLFAAGMTVRPMLSTEAQGVNDCAGLRSWSIDSAAMSDRSSEMLNDVTSLSRRGRLPVSADVLIEYGAEFARLAAEADALDVPVSVRSTHVLVVHAYEILSTAMILTGVGVSTLDATTIDAASGLIQVSTDLINSATESVRELIDDCGLTMPTIVR